MLERLTTGLIIILLYVFIIAYLVISLWNPEIFIFWWRRYCYLLEFLVFSIHIA